MQNQGQVKAILLTQFNAAGLNPAAFLPINPLGLQEACFLLRIVNDSTVPVFLSYDGNNDNEYVRPDDSLNLYGSPNSFKKGLIIYVSGAVGVGLILVSGYYAGV